MARGRKKAIAEGRIRLFVDESGFRSLPALVRTWAPQGQTPLLREWLTWDHLVAISAITPVGELYLELQDHAFKAPDGVRFLQHLLGQVPGKLLVVWDGLPTHRSPAIKDFLAAGAAQWLWLMQLEVRPRTEPARGGLELPETGGTVQPGLS